MSPDRYAPVEFEVTVLAATEKALLCELRAGRELLEVWIPRSQLLDGTEVEDRGDAGTLTIPHWLAEEKELV